MQNMMAKMQKVMAIRSVWMKKKKHLKKMLWNSEALLIPQEDLILSHKIYYLFVCLSINSVYI